MKILVLGVSGMAGHTIALYFKGKGHTVKGLSKTPVSFCDNIIGDVFDFESIRNLLIAEEFDVVINCVGLLNQSAETNHPDAVYLNSYLPHLIAQTTIEMPTKLLHMSTDCVFAGNTGPYLENSLQDGRTFYDRTKALGEVVDDKNLTFRNSIIGPDIRESGIGLFNWFMKQNGTIQGYSHAIWTGVTTITLARAMESAIVQNLCGLYNLVNNHNISKFDLIQLFNQYFRNSQLDIQRNEVFRLDKSLMNTRKDFDFIVPTYEEMVIEMAEWVSKYSNLYPHYKR